MLRPDDRSLLIDALRPPYGMHLDYAVGTTLSLDLEALLIAPVTFALFDGKMAEGGERADPLSILEAVRRHAANIDLFCQAGQIDLPDRYRPITAYLENSVHPSTARSPHHLFHPKVWVLRFRSESSTSYRLLVLSRNLTFSKSWDVVVRIDGVPGAPDAANEPLATFLGSLPDSRVNAASDLPTVTELANEVRSVEWTRPDGIRDLGFLAWGGDTAPVLPPYDRIMTVAPFASSKQLDVLATSDPDNVLISRSSTLDRVDRDVLDRFGDVYTLSSAAADTADEELYATEELAERPNSNLIGLHAKIYVLERGSRSTIVAGSTNATDAGFGGNVEFAVALTGRTADIGIDKILGGDGEGSLLSMLEPYSPIQDPDASTAAEKAEMRLDALGRQLSNCSFIAEVRGLDGDVFDLELESDGVTPDLGATTLRVWPISRQAAAVEIASNEPIRGAFSGLSLQAVTSFFCLELSERVEREEVTARFVVNAELTGAPEDRHQRILTAALQSKGDVMRYLLFLLADLGDTTAMQHVARLIASTNGAGGHSVNEIPLFESMVRALDRRPESLDHIDRLIVDLQRTPEGRAILPDGVEDVWPAIWQAKRELSP